MLLTIRSKFLLRLTWGRRLLYPSYVTAHHKLWLIWLFNSLVSKGKENVMVQDTQLVEAHQELEAAGLVSAEAKPEEVKVQVQGEDHVEGTPVTVH
jgi:hypothetical protein